MADSDKSRNQLFKDIRELRAEIPERRIHDIIMPEDLLQTIPDIVYKVDIKGLFVYVNDAVSILGYKPEELIGKKFDSIVHPEDFKRVSRKHVLPKLRGKITGLENAPKLFDERRTGDRKTQSLEIRLVHNHKATRKVRDEDIMTGMLFSYGELTSSGHYTEEGKGGRRKYTGSIGVIHDITPWKHAEIELKDSEQRYRMLVEDMPALICRFKKDSTLTFVNRAYCESFNREQENLVGTRWLKFIPWNEQKKLKDYVRKLTRKNPISTYEHKVKGPDGTVCWQRWTDRALFDAQGMFREYQSIGFDITDRKNAEESLRKSEEKLHEKNIQLQEKNIAIREMMEQVKIEKERVEQRIAANAEKLILPFLSRLLKSRQPIERKHLEILQKNIRNLTSDFGDRLSGRTLKLTQREIEVCNLIKEGMTSKEISRLLHVSTKTVENHRNNIRRKLKINNKFTNLHTYLSRIS